MIRDIDNTWGWTKSDELRATETYRVGEVDRFDRIDGGRTRLAYYGPLAGLKTLSRFSGFERTIVANNCRNSCTLSIRM